MQLTLCFMPFIENSRTMIKLFAQIYIIVVILKPVRIQIC